MSKKIHDEIFEHYLNDRCPFCGDFVDSETPKSKTISGGKVMAEEFQCDNCMSIYRVGFMRRSDPVESEIFIDNYTQT